MYISLYNIIRIILFRDDELPPYWIHDEIFPTDLKLKGGERCHG